MVNAVKKQDESLLASTKEHFDKIAKQYLIADIHRGADFEIIESAVSKIGRKDINAIDVGCGPGQHLVLLSKLLKKRSLGGSIIGVDFNKASLTEAQANLRINDVKDVNLLLAEGRKIPLKDSTASLVICMNNVLGNIPGEGADRKTAMQNAREARAEVLSEINRILSPDGYAVISVYRRGTEHYTGDLEVMDESSPKTGDYIVKMHSSGTTFYSHWFTPQEMKDLLKSTNFDLVELHEKDSRIIAVARKEDIAKI